MKLFCFLIVLLPLESAFSDSLCEFEFWETYEGDRLYITDSKTAYIFETSHVRIDADGSPNAYHPDDLGLSCTGEAEFKGLDCPANAGYPETDWWPSVLAEDPQDPNIAFVQSEGEFAGFFVSKTSLQNHAVPDTRSPERYVDASAIPYLVFPGNFYRKNGTGRLGDLGYAINLSTGDSSAFVIADIGPSSSKLGEISLRLAQALGGKNPNARTGAGSPSGKIRYMIFPYSGEENPWPLTANEIERIGTTLVRDHGGLDVVAGCQ